MSDRLFEVSFQSFRAQKTNEAHTQVDKLSDSQILNPAIAGHLEKIANACCFEVAILRPAERRGKRFKTTRLVNDYGRDADVEVTQIMVTIPFVGDDRSVQYSPSNCIEIQRNAHTVQGGVVATFDDDDQLDRNVDIFIERVSKNLDQLRKEMLPFRTELIAALGAAVDERATVIREQKRRDGDRSFPID